MYDSIFHHAPFVRRCPSLAVPVPVGSLREESRVSGLHIFIVRKRPGDVRRQLDFLVC
jgi:hypothetical protein